MAQFGNPVRVIRTTQLGIGNESIPIGTLGYRQMEARITPGKAYVYWPNLRGHKFAFVNSTDIQDETL